mgnify:FL=1
MLGEISIKEKEKIIKNELILKAKKSNIYKDVIKRFPDANLVDVIPKNNLEE